MGTSSWLATWMDWTFLRATGVRIEDEGISADQLVDRPGQEVARELRGRMLLRYLTARQVGTFRSGSQEAYYTTPTPYASDEVAAWLVVPRPQVLREHVLILDPARVDVIRGPQWVAMGRGIQYILPAGFPPEAIVVPGVRDGDWEVKVS